MSRIKLSIKGAAGVSPLATIDDQKVKLRKNSFGNLEGNFEATEGSVLKIYTWEIISSPLWLLWEFVFFVVSVFGIFDWGRGKYLREIAFEVVLHPRGDDTIVATILREKGEGSPALGLSCATETEIRENEYVNTAILKKRRKIVNWLRFIAWLCIIGCAIAIIANFF